VVPDPVHDDRLKLAEPPHAHHPIFLSSAPILLVTIYVRR
jgi:hypothetical protein